MRTLKCISDAKKKIKNKKSNTIKTDMRRKTLNAFFWYLRDKAHAVCEGKNHSWLKGDPAIPKTGNAPEEPDAEGERGRKRQSQARYQFEDRSVARWADSASGLEEQARKDGIAPMMLKVGGARAC
jgi:hypothetical protein